MKQTAVEWFLNEFKKQVWFEENSELDIWINDLIPKAKAMEKEQIENAYEIGFADAWDDARYDDEPKHAGAEQYYNETFNKSIKDKG
jgi:hypothetical protein